MFDNIYFKLENFSKERFSNFLTCETKIDGESLMKVYSKSGLKHFVNWENLRIEYYPNLYELRIKNSIHKFYNAHIINLGKYNYDAFCYNNFKESVECICHKLECEPNQLKLFGRFEYGLNIPLKQNPYLLIERLDSIVTTASNPFYIVPTKCGKPIEKRCDFTNYTVKFYDKSEQANIKGKILRYEIVNKNIAQTRKLLGKEQITMSDLLDKKNWNKFYFELQRIYSLIRKVPFAQNLSPTEYAAIKAYTDVTFIKDHKIILSDSKKYKRVFKECKKTYMTVMEREGKYFYELGKMFEESFSRLLN